MISFKLFSTLLYIKMQLFSNMYATGVYWMKICFVPELMIKVKEFKVFLKFWQYCWKKFNFNQKLMQNFYFFRLNPFSSWNT